MLASISACRSRRNRQNSVCADFAESVHCASASRGYFPFLPLLLERLVEFLANGILLRLPLAMDDVDLFVVRNGLQRDVRNSLVDESFFDIAIKMSPLPLG